MSQVWSSLWPVIVVGVVWIGVVFLVKHIVSRIVSHK